MSNSPILLETKRTIMRKLNVSDADDFFNLNLDTDVIKFTGDKAFENLKDAEDFLQNYDQFEKYRVGRLAVIDKSKSSFIGWCGLKYSPETNEYDIGFRFFKKYWNKGYATETATRCLQYGFEELGIKRIVGRAMKQNISSIKVLKKIGMSYIGDFDFDGNEGLMFELNN